MLLDAGADPRVADDDSTIALMSSHHSEIVAVLIEAAPETLSHKDNRGRTSLVPPSKTWGYASLLKAETNTRVS
jgi:hypothetical protein